MQFPFAATVADHLTPGLGRSYAEEILLRGIDSAASYKRPTRHMKDCGECRAVVSANLGAQFETIFLG